MRGVEIAQKPVCNKLAGIAKSMVDRGNDKLDTSMPVHDMCGRARGLDMIRILPDIMHQKISFLEQWTPGPPIIGGRA
jgi:hypothetical protein